MFPSPLSCKLLQNTCNVCQGVRWDLKNLNIISASHSDNKTCSFYTNKTWTMEKKQWSENIWYDTVSESAYFGKSYLESSLVSQIPYSDPTDTWRVSGGWVWTLEAEDWHQNWHYVKL